MQYPMSFPYKRIYKESLSSLNSFPFIITAMFTPDDLHYYRCADRLAASCEKYQLPFVVYEVPHIHRSVSRKGNSDLSFTKANCIFFNMRRFSGKDILYLDVDLSSAIAKGLYSIHR